MLKNITNWRIFEFVKDDKGQFSSARILAFSIVAPAIFEWQRTIWFGGGIWHPSYETVGLIAGVLGIKVLQKGSETKDVAKQTTKSPEIFDPNKK
jgi:hypothetical protein